MIKIRRLENEDIEKVLNLENEFPAKNRKPLTKEEISKMMEKPDACLVAEDDEEIVAFVLSEVSGEECIIRYANIVPNRMGESILAKLFEKIVNYTKCKKLVKV